MEGVRHKVSWDVYLRVGKRTPDHPLPHTHPFRQVRVDITNVMQQVTLPVHGQLWEDAEWKE